METPFRPSGSLMLSKGGINNQSPILFDMCTDQARGMMIGYIRSRWNKANNTSKKTLEEIRVEMCDILNIDIRSIGIVAGAFMAEGYHVFPDVEESKSWRVKATRRAE